VQHLRADTGELALQLRDLDLLEIDFIDDGRELASHPLRLAENVLELLLIADHQPVELRLRLLETDRLEDLRDHEQQNDRAEAVRDGIEKRQVQCLDIASLTLFHGQSSAGASIEPPVLSARSQYAGAASGSPSIASSITLTGTLIGSSRTARSKCCARSRPLTPGRLGVTLPIVGSPSAIK